MNIEHRSNGESLLIDRLAVSVAEAAKLLGLSERHTRTMISRGEIPSKRIGRRVVIPVDALRDILRRNDGAQHE